MYAGVAGARAGCFGGGETQRPHLSQGRTTPRRAKEGQRQPTFMSIIRVRLVRAGSGRAGAAVWSSACVFSDGGKRLVKDCPACSALTPSQQRCIQIAVAVQLWCQLRHEPALPRCGAAPRHYPFALLRAAPLQPARRGASSHCATHHCCTAEGCGGRRGEAAGRTQGTNRGCDDAVCVSRKLWNLRVPCRLLEPWRSCTVWHPRLSSPRRTGRSSSSSSCVRTNRAFFLSVYVQTNMICSPSRQLARGRQWCSRCVTLCQGGCAVTCFLSSWTFMRRLWRRGAVAGGC